MDHLSDTPSHLPRRRPVLRAVPAARALARRLNVDLAQVQSDAGLLEVDILELLYDCVPDGEHPSSGVGARCRSVADCDPSQVCDLDNGGGTCAPDPDNTHVGQPCTTTVDCGSDPRSACNNQVGDGFPDEVTAFRPGMAVHGRYGQPCPSCGTAVQRIRYAESEANYCPRCQTGGRLLADRGRSRLLGSDWPRTIDELEANRAATAAESR